MPYIAVPVPPSPQATGYKALGAGISGDTAGYVPVPPTVTNIPLTVAGCKLWLRGDLGITLNGGNVSAWADQSGQGNNAVQASAPNQPAFAASAIGGMPGVTFGPNLSLGGTSNLVAASSARTVFVVEKANAGSEGGSLLVFRTATNRYALQIFNAAVLGTIYTWTDCVAVNSQNSLVPADIDGTSNIIEATFDGNVGVSLQQMKLNGTVKAASGSAVTTDSGTAGFTVGMRLDNPTHECFFGSIAEVIVYDTVLSTANATTVRTYLKTRYGIP
jgi:hypothetical protein